jgi:hypothetical protein
MAGILIRAATVADLPFLWEMLYEAAFVLDETRTVPARGAVSGVSCWLDIRPSASVFAVTPSRAHSIARWRMNAIAAPLPAP